MGLAYVTLGTNDPPRSRLFYAAVMAPLGGFIAQDVPDLAFCCSLPDNGTIWITRPFDGAPASIGNGVTIALSAPSIDAVHAAHAAGVGAGGSDEGEPGPRPRYGPGVHVGYLRDPDGNKLAIVHYAATAEPAV